MTMHKAFIIALALTSLGVLNHAGLGLKEVPQFALALHRQEELPAGLPRQVQLLHREP
jgi:hypothetical protein